VIYLVAFDRVRVEDALADSGMPGRSYLEKILQSSLDLPAISQEVLQDQFFASLDAGLRDIENSGTLDSNAWPDIFVEIIRPLIRNMRDVRRFVTSARGTIRSLEGKVQLADVLGLEAIKVFLPDVFGGLHASAAALTSTSSGLYDSSESGRQKEQISSLLNLAKEDTKIVRAMIERLFPAAQRHIGGTTYGGDFQQSWLRSRRVAHVDILRLYLERTIPAGLTAFDNAEIAFGHFGDREALDQFMRSLAPDRWESTIAALETFEEDFSPNQAVPAITVLLNLLPDIPERKREFFDFGTRIVVTRVTYRLLRCLKSKEAVSKAVAAILPEINTLSAKYELISDVGYREGEGHKLVSKDAAELLEKAFRDEVRNASTEQLIKEMEVLHILLVTKRTATPEEPSLTIRSDTRLTLALLKNARSETLSQGVGSRAVQRSYRLAWDVLIELYGTEDLLRERLKALSDDEQEQDRELLALAERYLSGWRPEH
jgi:hypothetical protein